MTLAAGDKDESRSFAPGTTVVIRDEEWLVTGVEYDGAMPWLSVRGLRGIVRDQTAMFSPELDIITQTNPEDSQVIPDTSAQYRRSRLWLEAVIRKTAEPLGSPKLTVAEGGLVDALDYQLEAVRKALSADNLRTRILLADAVGLGKTIEIGMILSELIRRGRGDRILVVTPRHVLEQMQMELWTRFAIPFVRLDSAGIQKVRQHIPATRNPFTYYPRAIVSIDTLKSDQYVHQIRKQHWDVVVIDESHNLANSETQNNRLARTLAKNTDALILASATPHNGKKESFAELVRLLDPTAVSPTGEIDRDRVRDLVIRRHRHSGSVASEVGADWAERRQPKNLMVEASPAEDEIASELASVWLHPRSGESPFSGTGTQRLFPWVLAKAFLSSPAALLESVESRMEKLAETDAGEKERVALERLAELSRTALESTNSKFDRLVAYLKEIGVAKNSETRAVVFAERVKTLEWLSQRLPKALGMKPDQFAVMHGSLDDQEQQQIVAEFRQSNSPLRVLITGDVASEGVNLHAQCHDLIHYDIPWSLIRIEQRNGRIDRYGQKTSPQIATIALVPSDGEFSGDIRVLTSLMAKEDEAHRALGDAGSLMGKHTPAAEEEEIRRVLAREKSLEDVVKTPEEVKQDDSLDALFAEIMESSDSAAADSPAVEASSEVSDYEFLRGALDEAFEAPASRRTGEGVALEYHGTEGVASFVPPSDLAQRLRVLPQSYLRERSILEKMVLATSKTRGKVSLREALSDRAGSSWPNASYLAPLHPVLDWAADRAMAELGRGEIFAVRGSVDFPTVLLLGTLTNKVGAVTGAIWMSMTFYSSDPTVPPSPTAYGSAKEALEMLGIGHPRTNPGAVQDVSSLQHLVPPAVHQASSWASVILDRQGKEREEDLDAWFERTTRWQEFARTQTQRKGLRERESEVMAQKQYLEDMKPDHQSVRPLIVVVPESWGN